MRKNITFVLCAALLLLCSCTVERGTSSNRDLGHFLGVCDNYLVGTVYPVLYDLQNDSEGDGYNAEGYTTAVTVKPGEHSMTVTVSRIGDFVWKLEGTGKGLSMEAELSRELLKDGRAEWVFSNYRLSCSEDDTYRMELRSTTTLEYRWSVSYGWNMLREELELNGSVEAGFFVDEKLCDKVLTVWKEGRYDGSFIDF